MSNRRIATVAVVAVVAVGLLAFFVGRSTAPTTTTTSSTTTSSSTTTTGEAATWTAVWPTAAGAVRYLTPQAAALGFAVDFLHMTGPVVEAFRQGDSRSGEVPVRPSATGPVTTVMVRQLTSDNSWWVLGAATPNISISVPSALATVNSPLAISGTSTAFEALVNVSLRQDDVTSPLVETTVMGGGNGQMGPFKKTLSFSSPSSHYGALVMYTVSAKDGSVSEASVIRLKFH